jgi:hypothetical protein
MAALFYVRDGRGAVTGPHTAEEIDRQASAGRLPASWYISTDGICWVPIHRRNQAEPAPPTASDPFEALFPPPVGGPRLLREVSKTWRWYTRPRSFLRATITPDGWRFVRHDLVSGRQSPLTAAEADRAVAQAVRALNWFPLLAGALFVLWLWWALLDFSLLTWLFKAFVVLLLAGIAHFVKRKWGTLFVGYEMDRDERSRLQAARNAFATLRRCSRVWLAPSSGVPTSVEQLQVVKLDRPVTGLFVNVRVPGLVCGDVAVHVLPDKVLLVDHSGARFLSASSCTIAAEEFEAVGPEGPLFRDAEVVGRRPTNRNSTAALSPEGPGSPILRVGLLRLHLGDKQLALITSDPRAPARFREEFFSTPSVAGDEAVGEEALAGRSTAAALAEGAQRCGWRIRRHIWPALRRGVGSIPGRAWLGALGLVVLALVMIGIIWWAGAGDRDIARANQLWDDNDHAAAVNLYKKWPTRFWRSDTQEKRNLWRVVQSALDRGDRAEAAAWIDQALEHGVQPEAPSEELKTLYAERLAERERRLAVAAAAQRQREQEEEARWREADEAARRPERERQARERAEQEATDREMMEEARRKREERERQAEQERKQRREEEDEQYIASEARAARELVYARKLLDQGMHEAGTQRLRDLIREHPGTASAAEARQVLREVAGK